MPCAACAGAVAGHQAVPEQPAGPHRLPGGVCGTLGRGPCPPFPPGDALWNPVKSQAQSEVLGNPRGRIGNIVALFCV